MTNDLRGRVAERRNGGRGQRQTGKAGKELAIKAKTANARALMQQMKPQFAMALPKHIGVDRFLRMALTCMQKSPKLLDCDPASVLAALMESARLGLEPGTKQAAIVPMGDKATFIAQWQGLVELMYRSGQVASVTAEFIHEGDEWDYSIGDGGGFRHKPNLLGDRGKPVLVYAFATMKSGARSKIVFLTREDAEKIRDERSKNYAFAESNGKRNSTWHTDFDAMWRKSAVRRLADWVPSSPELRDLIGRENEAGEIDLADVVLPEDIVDGEVVDDEPKAPPAEDPGGLEQEQPPAPASMTQHQSRVIGALFNDIGWTDRADRLRASSTIIRRELRASSEMNRDEADELIDQLQRVAAGPDPATGLADLLAEIRDGAVDPEADADAPDGDEPVDAEVVDGPESEDQ